MKYYQERGQEQSTSFIVVICINNVNVYDNLYIIFDIAFELVETITMKVK